MSPRPRTISFDATDFDWLCDDLDVDYYYYSGEKATRDYPGCPEDLDIVAFRINGAPVGFDAFDDINEEAASDIEQAIKNYIKDYLD